MFKKTAIHSAITAAILLTSGIANADITNISTRGLAGAGDNKMIAGFAITGSDSLKVAIVAGGPTLSSFGVPNVLTDPKLTVYNGNTIIATNDSWGNDADIAALSNPPQNDKEAGVVMTLAPGSYTVHVESSNGQTSGNAIVAVENIDNTSNSSLTNISTRSQVGAGDEKMIAGFVISGSPQKVVMVAAGPTLADFGVTDVLADPEMSLQLQTSPNVIASNDNWGNNADVAASAIKPSHDSESGLVTTLSAGSYTVVVGGVNNGTGNAIIGIEDYATSSAGNGGSGGGGNTGGNGNCVNISLPASGTRQTFNVSANGAAVGTVNTTYNSIGDTQSNTTTHSELSTQGISTVTDSTEVQKYEITANKIYVSSVEVSGTSTVAGFSIPVSSTITNTPAQLLGPAKVYCEGETWTAPSVSQSVVANGFNTTSQTEVSNGKVVSINESVTVPAGTFTTVRMERTESSGKTIHWLGTSNGLTIKQQTFDNGGALTGETVTASIN